MMSRSPSASMSAAHAPEEFPLTIADGNLVAAVTSVKVVGFSCLNKRTPPAPAGRRSALKPELKSIGRIADGPGGVSFPGKGRLGPFANFISRAVAVTITGAPAPLSEIAPIQSALSAPKGSVVKRI